MIRSPFFALLLLVLAAVGVGVAAQKELKPNKLVIAPRFLQKGSEYESLVRKDISNARSAKSHRYFWIQNTGGEGFAVDALSSPKLFAALFPGYPDAMREDADLWRSYFSRTFEIDTFNGAMSRAFGEEFVVIEPWIGCLDIYKKYGADVVVMGTSEIFRGIMVDELAKGLSEPGEPTPKILLCTASAMQVNTAAVFAKRLKEARPELQPKVLFGLSLSVAFVEGRQNDKNGREKLETLREADLQSAHSRTALFQLFQDYHEVSFANLFPRITWEEVLPHTYRSREDNYRRGGYVKTAKASGKEKTKGGYVLAGLKDDPQALAQDIGARIPPYYRVYDDYNDEKFCRSAARKEQLFEVMQALHELSRDVYLYIPPTTPLAFMAATECFRRQVASDLAAAGQTIGAPVLTDEWDGYGLNYTDYLRPTFNPEVYKVDIQHTNYRGARKVTARIAAWMKRGGRR